MAGLPEGRPEDDTEEQRTEGGGAAESNQDASGAIECPICLQACMHPVELPCRHVFCFLCVKGVAMQGPNSKCAICRSPIPYSVLTNPHLKDVSQLLKEPKLPNGYQWYYESRSGGWWQYDERTMQDLERAFLSEQPTCQLLVAGHVYTVDFKQMIQYRTQNRNISRRIKRGMNLEKRGVAGLRIAGSAGAGSSGGGGDGSSSPPQGPAVSTRRNRRVNSSSAASGVPANPASGQSSAVTGNCSVVSSSNAGSESGNPPISHNLAGNLPRQRDEFSDSDDESLDEDEDYNSDYSDVDEDMELGEEEEALIGDDSDERETEDEEEYDTRDGARAPTRRSDRSNSSNNQTPPPPSGAGISNGSSGRTYSPNGRGSRGARSGRSSGGGGGGSRSSNGTSGSNSRAAPIGLSSPQSPASSNSNVLAPLFFNRCNLEDVGQRCNVNVSNNNIYLDLDAHRIIDQSVRYTVTQTFSSITNSTNNVKVSFDKHSSLNQEEFL